MPESHVYVSLCLLRPCRSWEQARSDIEARVRLIEGPTSRIKPKIGPERNTNDVAPRDQ